MSGELVRHRRGMSAPRHTTQGVNQVGKAESVVRFRSRPANVRPRPYIVGSRNFRSIQALQAGGRTDPGIAVIGGRKAQLPKPLPHLGISWPYANQSKQISPNLLKPDHHSIVRGCPERLFRDRGRACGKNVECHRLTLTWNTERTEMAHIPVTSRDNRQSRMRRDNRASDKCKQGMKGAKIKKTRKTSVRWLSQPSQHAVMRAGGGNLEDP